ncbi:BrnT family toxin [Aquabacterium sp.]|uniref:BrnT family toxin n=1 Tax=Aquabacterium sp. TaxID=1872578 RepID=UPI002488A57B|nr:BrnT family toxin [Aquabacterium sp.]MDI1349692.1 BrnT family toxin [Aquabacterium sp.]
MRVTYDPGKSSRNEALRGLSFELAKQFDWSGAQLIEDTRKDYSEQRIQALGQIGEHLHVMVFTPRDGAVHVISLRRANRRERTRYAAQAQP